MAYLLHLDDDPDDLDLFEEVLKKVDPKMGYECFVKAYECLAFLKETDNLPCAIIVDLNIPIMGGKEFMVAIKELPELRPIPLIALTTSTQPTDREFCMKYCDAFFTKPLDYSSFTDLIHNIFPYCGRKSNKP